MKGLIYPLMISNLAGVKPSPRSSVMAACIFYHLRPIIAPPAESVPADLHSTSTPPVLSYAPELHL